MNAPRHPRFARTLALAALLAAGAAAPALAVDSKDNAALGYWRAFALVTPDRADAISAFDRSTLGAPDFALVDDAVLSVVRDDALIDRLLDSAAKPDCDFAIEYERGLDALLPHLGPMRTGARILAIRARLDLAEGRPDHAAACLDAAIRSAEHLIGDDTLISSLVSAAITASVQPVLEFALAEGLFDAGQRATLRAALDRFAKDDPFGVVASIRREKGVIALWASATLTGPGAPDAITQVAGDSPVAARLAKAVANGADIRPQIALYEAYMDRAAAALAARDGAAIDDLRRAVESGAFGDVALLLAPGFDRLLVNLERSDATLASMRDALAR